MCDVDGVCIGIPANLGKNEGILVEEKWMLGLPCMYRLCNCTVNTHCGSRYSLSAERPLCSFSLGVDDKSRRKYRNNGIPANGFCVP